MKRPTLDEFLTSHFNDTRQYPLNLWVKEKGVKALYVRYGKRYINKVWNYPVLDIASIVVTRPRKGTFTSLISRLTTEHPTLILYVECVTKEWFMAKLLRMGFKPSGLGDSFVLLPKV